MLILILHLPFSPFHVKIKKRKIIIFCQKFQTDNTVTTTQTESEAKIMKKKLKLAGIIFLILIIGFLIWYFVPTRLCKIDAQQVERIMIIDGSRGTKLDFTDSETITYLIDNWNSTYIRKWIPLVLPMGGFQFSTTIYLESGKTKQFTIQTEDIIKTDIWICERVKGNLCYEYIDEQSEAAR